MRKVFVGSYWVGMFLIVASLGVVPALGIFLVVTGSAGWNKE